MEDKIREKLEQAERWLLMAKQDNRTLDVLSYYQGLVEAYKTALKIVQEG